MKPTSYKNLPAYGQAQAQAQAVQAQTPNAVKTIMPAQIESEFYKMGLDRSIKLGYLGLQKDMFDQNLAENKRQFDVGLGESKREFQLNRQFLSDQFKYQRRQNNMAEILGMVNVGINIGFGYQQYKQNQRQIGLYKQISAVAELQKMNVELKNAELLKGKK